MKITDSVEKDAGLKKLYQIGGFRTIILFEPVLEDLRNGSKLTDFKKRKKTTPSLSLFTATKCLPEYNRAGGLFRPRLYRQGLCPGLTSFAFLVVAVVIFFAMVVPPKAPICSILRYSLLLSVGR